MIAQHDKKSPLIFVAEDNPNVRDLVLTQLELAGYQTAHGRDGAEAIEGITATRPAVIILDVNMPKASGFDVLSHLQTNNELRSIPAILMTARNSPDDIREALRLGAKDYLVKPFTVRQLLVRIERLLRPRRDIAPADENEPLI